MAPIYAPDPTVEAGQSIAHLRLAFADLERSIMDKVPNNRERSLALTNLEQASMWTTKAICMGGA